VSSSPSFSESIEKVGRRGVVDEVRERLIASIQSGELGVNERLPSENELARLFGVSRPAIREALVSLEAMGLTVAKNGSGTFVVATQVKAELMFGGYAPAHLNQVRRYVEIPSAEEAARRCNEAQLAEIASIIERLEAEGDPARRNKLDADFHVAIALATGNPLLANIVGNLRTMVEEEAFTAARLPQRRSQAHDEHRAIYAAIAAKDPKRAKAAMTAHMDSIDRSIADLERHPGNEPG
jgi:GntR family transcriptional regulator, transcriptional repressor for pyruvate dehydrogenase complex